jgi:hypothetical protein
MKRFESGEALAKEIGVSPEVLKKTCRWIGDRRNTKAYTQSTTTTDTPRSLELILSARRLVPSSCDSHPADHQFYSGGDFRMDDVYHVALMVRDLNSTGGTLLIVRLPFFTTPWVVWRSEPTPPSTTATASPSLVFSLAASLLEVSTVPTVSEVPPFCELNVCNSRRGSDKQRMCRFRSSRW